ncbi:hypothetical protein E2C01_079267 [Portunus trituberculatus]|uniref:Uncharacterized protein n=1 Tax=Portunus trituberculatus TaxID=210409 RepID=A0A5B7IV49_PORTR|nr:hypothetical protein [Portunus trituberculatus]
MTSKSESIGTQGSYPPYNPPRHRVSSYPIASSRSLLPALSFCFSRNSLSLWSLRPQRRQCEGCGGVQRPGCWRDCGQ